MIAHTTYGELLFLSINGFFPKYIKALVRGPEDIDAP